MLRKQEKAQGLVEFALILPVLLLLLLGIIEGARVIWSYITVQTAVREAARYAISGKPYAADTNSTACLTPEGDINATAPWICDPYSRTVAIENVAMNRITTSLNVSTPCRSGGFTQCEGVSNAYAVRVIGQYTEDLTPTDILTGVGHSGNQGLMVRIEAYYNVQMLDPIFDTIMAGNVIPVRAAIEMQNEGIDSVLGSIPPPAIGNTTGITGSTGSGQGPNGERIYAQNYRVPQLSNLGVVLENHFNLAGPYDIHLSDGTNDHTLTCTPASATPPSVNTNPATNNGDFSCFISGDIVPGFYTLFSTLAGFQNPLATDLNQQVEIYLDDVPKILVDNGAGGNIVATNSPVEIQLHSHQVTNQPYTVTVVYGATEQTLFPNVTLSGSPHRIDWTVPATLLNPSNPCPTGGGTPCLVRSYDKNGQLYASGEFYLNQPEIVIAGGLRIFAQNETMLITLRGHSPGVQYDIKISDGGSNQLWLGRTNAADAVGQVTSPIRWTVPVDWPGGNYTLSSHPASGNIPRNPASMTSGNQVVSLAIQIDTPNGPYLTIEGGYTWPAGSVINIQANKHPQVDNPYYFNFGVWRVPIPTGNPVNTFDADSNQSFVAVYNIPLTATNVAATFSVESHRNANNNLVAQRDVTVLPVPVLLVLEGTPVSPDSIITVQILNHPPDSTFNIFYLDQPLGAILTDANGQGQLKYDLKNLPVNVPPGLPSSFGTPYPVASRSIINGSTIATYQLTLRAADLRVTSIQIPPNPTLNSSARITFTIQNTSPVTISRYFDTDLYFDPKPQTPLYSLAQVNNFPGDYKYWRNQLGPGASFTLTQTFFIGSYGPHLLYSYADTSNLIFNELSEFNNVLSNTLTLTCTTATYSTDTFNSGVSTWAQEPYGNGDNNGTAPQIVTVSGNQRLRIRSDGSSTLRSDDNALQSGPTPAGGYTFVRKTTPITSSSGLDVRVQVRAAPNNTNGAKAGLELRNTLSPTSPKLEFGLTRSGNNTYRVQVVYRDSAVPEPLAVYQSAALNLGTNPIWLRIERYGGTNTFLFYYVQSATTPASWGDPVHIATINLANQLEYGLFVNNNTNGSHQNADFDNFVVFNPGSCPSANGQPPDNNIPPGQATCSDPLLEKGFETVPPIRWLGIGSNGTFLTTSSYAGNQALLADTNRSGANNPIFYQRVTMPTGLVSSTTSVKLELYRNVEQEVDGPDSADQFYAVLSTSSNIASAVTNPLLVSSGELGAVGYDPSKWQKLQANFQPISGVSLADYAGQDLFLIFYNNSNQASGCPPNNCHNTSFYFDNIVLSPCTVQPLPTVINTRITGEVVLHPSAGSAQKISGVKVWAYAEGGELYETTTIQNGEFNFYNLPATTSGIKYILYSEHHIVSSLDPNQIETLSTLSSILLSNTNNNTNPVVTKLDLY